MAYIKFNFMNLKCIYLNTNDILNAYLDLFDPLDLMHFKLFKNPLHDMDL